MSLRRAPSTRSAGPDRHAPPSGGPRLPGPQTFAFQSHTMPAVGARLGEAVWVQREGLRSPSPHFRSQRWSFVKMLASGLLGDDDITMSHTGAGLWGAGAGGGPGLRAEPFRPHRRSRSLALACACHSRAHVGRAPAPFARALPRSSLPGLRIGPRAAAHCRRGRHHGCQRLLRSAVQQPRPPAGPPRAPGCRKRARTAGPARGWPARRRAARMGGSQSLPPAPACDLSQEASEAM